MSSDEHEGSADSAVHALHMPGWLGPIGPAWWLGAEPERRPRRPGQVAGELPARAVRTVFDEVLHRRASSSAPTAAPLTVAGAR